ncbi:MAG: pyridoxal-dependent decarboxylase [Cyanobacteriota bacterium]
MENIAENDFLKKAFDIALEYLKNRNKKSLVRKNLNPYELLDKFNIELDVKNNNYNDILEILEKSLDYSLNTSHPLFMNQLYGGSNLIAVLGDIFTSILNTSVYTYEVAPLMTLIEKECIKKLGYLIGFGNNFDGTFTAGGSISNMSAMLLAKDKKFPDSKINGLKGTALFSIFVSEQAHYSFLKNSMLLGFGKESIVKIKSDYLGKIDTKELEKSIISEKNKNRIPLMIVGTAGTTINGIFDNIEELNEIAKKNKIWFHVDACYGGSLLFSNLHNNHLKGINNADSVSWNLHKMMGIPLICSALIIKEKKLLENTFSINADYLFHEDSSEYDLGNKSLQCGRRPDAFKLWLTWQIEGKKGFENRVNKLLQKAIIFAKKIQNNNNFILFNYPETPIVCFQFIYPNLSQEKINEINKKIRISIFEEGEIIFNYAEIKNKTILRCVISNPEITEDLIDQIIKTIEKKAHNILIESYL